MVRWGYVQVVVDVFGIGVFEGGWELFGEDEQVGFVNMDVDNVVIFNIEYFGNVGLFRIYVLVYVIDLGVCYVVF